MVFIRLLLIRVCEDKELFQGEDRVAHRFVSDGGMKQWQETIKRYWIFATGNPYSPLLDMAYNNAQNIYAHFFTGRELFNWYQLNEQQLIMTLYQLSRFNFAGVDSDIVGTVYNTYVSRKEKKEKGQYYTPPEIVNYILDEVGYVSGAGIIGKNKRLIDPACGSGSFLVAAAKRLVSAYKNNTDQIDDPVTVLERVQANLFGFDLNPFACYLAEVNLLIQVLDLVKLAYKKQQHQPIKRFHIYNVDALARPAGTYRFALFNTLIAEESDQVDQIKSRSPNTSYANGFAFVVANPPYGAKLSDAYKNTLRADYADVFYGKPDTYIFFLKLGTELLAKNGSFGFITPNTYLMGINSAALRRELLNVGGIYQIVDLPQGIWADANVDCVLLFLNEEDDEKSRRNQKVQINLLGIRDTLDKLTTRDWAEVLTQPQTRWMDDSKYEFDIRYDLLMQKVDRILAKNTQLNQLREQGYTIKRQRDGNTLIAIPYDRLLSEIQQQNPNFSTLNFFDARAAQLFSIPEKCNLQETISSNVFIPPKYPTSVVLRNNKLWFEIPDENIRRYLLGYLKVPQWQGKTWDEIKNQAQIPEEESDLNAFFAWEDQKRQTIQTLLDEVDQIDAEIDEKVLNLYDITDPTDRQRILESGAKTDEEAETTDTTEPEEE